MEQKTKSKKYKYYEVKISIRDTHPPVWRRLQIPSGITFHELSAIIQLAFDWGGYHAYNFEIGSTLHDLGISIELPGDDFFGYSDTKNSLKEKIDNYLENYSRMKYIYDFGDNWVHDIVIEKIVETDKKLAKPVCIKAKMASIPDDCGGPYGYEELLEILSDKNNKRYKEMREWVDDWVINWNDDREYVDLDEINKKLETYKNYAKFLLDGEI